MSITYNHLQKLCTQAGTNLAQICRDANLDRSVLERWKKEEPKTLIILASLLKAIEERKNANSQK